jgi:hypoxanthine phosphoribosyltransferase
MSAITDASHMEQVVAAEPRRHHAVRTQVKVFVLMPFGTKEEYQGGNAEAEYVYREIIEPGVNRAFAGTETNVSMVREVDKAQSGSITDSIVRGLVEADIVVVDITGQNANVFLELGIRYALKSKITVLITQEPEKVPFDIQGYRFIEYNRFDPERARDNIAKFIRQGSTEVAESDSVVFDVFKDMSVIIPGVSESHGPQSTTERKETMRWDDYMNRVTSTIAILEQPLTEGRYTPDALVGISNGGLIVADLIGRRVFQEKPILALWANRRTAISASKYRFFDNPYNVALCEALKSSAQGDHRAEPLRLTLVDDHFGSGTTALQAEEFLKATLGEHTKILYIPMVSRRINYLDIVEHMLPYAYEDPPGRKVFGVSKDEFIDLLRTTASYFPYLQKDIIGE